MAMLTNVFARLIAPQQNVCHLCDGLLTAAEHTLCAPCQKALARCRVQPFEALFPLEDGLALAGCWYQDEARALQLRLKYQHDRAAAPPLAYGMCAAYCQHFSALPPIDGVAVVPSHPARMKERGYNQASLLAQAFCDYTSLPFWPDVLRREHHSVSQVHRTRAERLNAMRGAFAACRAVPGMNILLVDDVLTTGATAVACVQCLREAGAASVTVLVACRA